MDFQIECITQLNYIIYITFSPKEVSASWDTENTKLAKTDGPNSAGANTLEHRIKSMLGNTAVNVACDRFNLYPVGKIDIDFSETVCKDKILPCKLSMEVLPDIQLPEKLEDLNIDVEEPIVQPGELHESMRRFQRSMGKFDPVMERRLPHDLDVLNLDITCTYNGRVIPGLSAKGFYLQLGQNQTNTEVAKLARTLHAGEKAHGVLRCSDNYPEIELRGKEIDLHVCLNSINNEILPPLSDTLAHAIGRKNLQALYGELHSALLKRKLDASRKKAEQHLLSSLVDIADFPVPQKLFNIHKQQYLLEARHHLHRQGYEGKKLQSEMEALSADCEFEAMRLAKIQTYLMVLGYREKISVSNQDIERSLQDLSKASKQDEKTLKANIEASGALPELLDRILAEKTLDMLYSKVQKRVLDINGNTVSRPQAEMVCAGRE